jgi:hypothetical protein
LRRQSLGDIRIDDIRIDDIRIDDICIDGSRRLVFPTADSAASLIHRRDPLAL